MIRRNEAQAKQLLVEQACTARDISGTLCMLCSLIS